MAPHSSTVARKIPWTEDPGRLPSMGSLQQNGEEAGFLPGTPGLTHSPSPQGGDQGEGTFVMMTTSLQLGSESGNLGSNAGFTTY